MNDEMEKTLTKVFCDVLGKYALMFGDEIAADEAALEGGLYVHATINFHGDKKGSMDIIAGTAFSGLLDLNILGDAEAGVPADDATHDSFKEFLNIMCGEYLSVLFGRKMLFNLDPPTVRTISAETAAGYLANVKNVFMVEDTPVIVYAGMET